MTYLPFPITPSDGTSAKAMASPVSSGKDAILGILPAMSAQNSSRSLEGNVLKFALHR